MSRSGVPSLSSLLHLAATSRDIAHRGKFSNPGPICFSSVETPRVTRKIARLSNIDEECLRCSSTMPVRSFRSKKYVIRVEALVIFRDTRKTWFLVCQHSDKTFDERASSRHNFRFLGKSVVYIYAGRLLSDARTNESRENLSHCSRLAIVGN